MNTSLIKQILFIVVLSLLFGISSSAAITEQNPTDRKFTLTSSTDSPIRSITVYNQVGELVFSEEYSDAQFNRDLNLSKFDAGIYFILVNEADEENSSFNKVVIK